MSPRLKKSMHVLIVVALLIAGACVYCIIRFPFLSPWYRDKYSADTYRVIVDSTNVPQSSDDILASFDDLYPYWLGTKWDFNGITEVPGEGEIACGYFVTTMVRDMGIPVDRVAMAQCASEEMIKNLIGEEEIHRYSRNSVNDIIDDMERKGEQLYIIGLDNHTGFIRYTDGKAWFIHSSGRFPYRVLCEPAATSKTINASDYKVLGCLSDGAKLLK